LLPFSLSAATLRQSNPTVTIDELDPELRVFLSKCVHTFEQLEVLLLLHRSGSRYLSTDEIATGLAVRAEVTLAELEQLADKGLLAADPTRPGRYRLSPATPWLRQQVEALIRAERERRLAIVQEMSTNAIERLRNSAIRTFAEAFRLRGDGGKGG